MDHKQGSVVTRFAPSPTGFLHIGGVRSALYAWLWARKNNGTFILRIEDTDKAREVTGSIEHIQESLQWLGLDWDYGPDKPGPFGSCIQSERLNTYKKYALQLVKKGLAYPDPYTDTEVAAFRELAQKENRPFLFRHHRPDTFGEWDGTQPLRFKVPEVKRCTWRDTVRGKLSAGEEMLDDIIIMKADGYPTYNFAHIIDDHEMGVTHVMRGEEFIASTPKFLSVYDALELPYPEFVTLPPILGPDGKKKLSKRDGAKDLLEYRDDGYLPEAMRNFLALVGWNPGGDEEIIRDDDLLSLFTLEKIQRSGGAFNEEKLKWMNKEYLKQQTPEIRTEYVLQAMPEKLSITGDHTNLRYSTFADTVLERQHTLREIKEAAETGEYDWVFRSPEYEPSILKWKNDNVLRDALPRLEKVQALFKTADFTAPEHIKASIWSYVEETGKGEVLWPLRVALSGREKSPDPFTLAYVLGAEETSSRIETACDKITR